MASKTSIIGIGTGKVYIADKLTTGILAATWTEAFQTLKDSLKLEQADGDVVEVYVDQSALPVYSVKKAGKLTLTFSVPNLSTTMLNLFFNVVSETSNDADYEAIGMKMDLKTIDKMIKIELNDGEQVWVFYNLTISRKLTGSTLSTAPMVIEVTAEVTANPDPTKSDFIILNELA